MMAAEAMMFRRLAVQLALDLFRERRLKNPDGDLVDQIVQSRKEAEKAYEIIVEMEPEKFERFTNALPR